MVNILVFAWSAKSGGNFIVYKPSWGAVAPQSRKIKSRNNNNRKSNQVTYEMWKNNINCIHERQIYCSISS